MRMPDREMTEFLESVVGAIEATRFEQHCLWEKYTEYGVSWEQSPSGLLENVGAIADMPVCISLHKVRIGGETILFYHATSQVVDHRMIDQWLANNLPTTARHEDGRPNKTDASNSHIVASFVCKPVAA
jgi:hypothetical protein